MVQEIRRRRAESLDVDYSDPIELHDSARMRIELVPFFINRTAGGELACKLVRHDKTHDGEETSISLQAPAARRLYDALGHHLAVVDERLGAYVVIRTDGTLARDTELDPAQVASAIEQLLRTEGLAEHISQIDLGAELVHALRTDLRLRELRGAVAELTNHLREGAVEEAV